MEIIGVGRVWGAVEEKKSGRKSKSKKKGHFKKGHLKKGHVS